MPVTKQESSQIKSKERVAARGEVFTAEREVNAMLDLVNDDCLRPDSRFLEPACGDGNFLAAILLRKLTALREKYKKSAFDYERNAILAIGSLYGVDILSDNVMACRERLFNIWNEQYTAHCKADATDEVRQAARFIIDRNIVNGNALSLMCVDNDGNDTASPIVFSQWTLVGNTQMQRSDYTMDQLLNQDSKQRQGSIFDEDSETVEGATFLRKYVTHYKKVQYGE